MGAPGRHISMVRSMLILSRFCCSDRAGAAIEGVGNQLAIKLAPYIEAAANAFADLVAGERPSGRYRAVDLQAARAGGGS